MLRLYPWLYCFMSVLAMNAIASDRPPAQAIASAHPLATQAGMAILNQGGNAFDAAVTVSAVLAVVEPYGSGLGGGGFWLLHQGASQKFIMIDGREKAPLAATQNMFLDSQGQVIPQLSRRGALAAGIPGQPAALVHIAQKYGQLPLSVTLAPAIDLARKGFAADQRYRNYVQRALSKLQQFPSTADVFLSGVGVPALGELIKQPDLAATLSQIAQHGQAGFYRGEVAQRLVDGVRKQGGIWQLADLQQYAIVERQPIVGTYHHRTIISAPPPSSGGVVLVQSLNLLQQWSAVDTHLIVEAMRRAYRDRAVYLGDPDFVDMPIQRLLSQAYAVAQAAATDLLRATPSQRLKGPSAVPATGENTTHFSILDRAGNAVAATLSINTGFGSGYMPPGTGVLLNNEMDDFSIQPGFANAYGLVGGQANAIVPGKRMLSSMAPTMVKSKDGLAILGTPGGSRIISMVLLAILAHDQQQAVFNWVSQARFHHQYLPDEIQFEPAAFTLSVQQALRAQGHHLHKMNRRYGNMQVVFWDKRQHTVIAVSDPRGLGLSLVEVIQDDGKGSGVSVKKIGR